MPLSTQARRYGLYVLLLLSLVVATAVHEAQVVTQ